MAERSPRRSKASPDRSPKRPRVGPLRTPRTQPRTRTTPTRAARAPARAQSNTNSGFLHLAAFASRSMAPSIHNAEANAFRALPSRPHPAANSGNPERMARDVLAVTLKAWVFWAISPGFILVQRRIADEHLDDAGERSLVEPESVENDGTERSPQDARHGALRVARDWPPGSADARGSEGESAGTERGRFSRRVGASRQSRSPN